jgi:hypothetical protein
MVVGVHMCRGNYKGMYLSEGGYDSVAEKLFGARASTISCSSSIRRAREASRRCAFLPKTKGVRARDGQQQGAAARDDRRR